MDGELLKYTQNRELSWLKFNKRVLEEAKDPDVPLMERMKFVAIFTSNLDEFFMIRVGSLYDMASMKVQTTDKRSGRQRSSSWTGFMRRWLRFTKSGIKLMRRSKRN